MRWNALARVHFTQEDSPGVGSFSLSAFCSSPHSQARGTMAMANSGQKHEEQSLDDCSLYGSWIFSVMGALLAIPVGIKRKSLGPLVFFGSTGAMLDIVQGFADCERQRIEKERAAEQLLGESGSPSGELVFKEDGQPSNFANR